jgi:hypothetical protein
MTIEVRLKIHSPMHSKVDSLQLVENRRQAELTETSYVKLSKVSFLSSHARRKGQPKITRAVRCTSAVYTLGDVGFRSITKSMINTASELGLHTHKNRGTRPGAGLLVYYKSRFTTGGGHNTSRPALS